MSSVCLSMCSRHLTRLDFLTAWLDFIQGSWPHSKQLSKRQAPSEPARLFTTTPWKTYSHSSWKRGTWTPVTDRREGRTWWQPWRSGVKGDLNVATLQRAKEGQWALGRGTERSEGRNDIRRGTWRGPEGGVGTRTLTQPEGLSQ